jgi:hypothetical protein
LTERGGCAHKALVIAGLDPAIHHLRNMTLSLF